VLRAGYSALAAAAALTLAAMATGCGGATSSVTHTLAGAAPTRASTQPSSTGAAASAAASGPPGHRAIPILMYHVIAPPPATAPYPGLYVQPSEFGEQMRALKQAGWHAVTLDQVQAYWRRGSSLGAGKPIVLSFDNGYRSQYTQALPVLRSLGWVGDENIQLSGLPPSQGGLSEVQVKGMIAAGWELDTQGYNHADLITLGAAELHYQVATTRRTLQQRYGVPVNWFCYPSGHYDATVIAAVKAAGFVGSTTVVPGWAQPAEDRYRLHRLRVLGGTGAQALLALVEGSRSSAPAPETYPGA
jgi:peptidoglycan/xylan/chitin deacetylase (PgdA/CDA1 family)